ncbi:hypothetical protein, partial [Nostoc sp. NMS4]|uniref:hypothetical protein n=1 Tax=Nostoc sp. NMS4 TaxID=2815390 RepID=UPI0025CC400B
SGLGKLNPEQQANREQLLKYRKELGKTLNKDNQLINQVELDALIGETSGWAGRIETGKTQKIARYELKRLEELLKKSQPELEGLLKSSGTNKLTKKQEDNKTYLQGIRKTLGENLGRKNKSITQAELSFLIGKSFWVEGIELGNLKEIKPEDREKLEDLLTKPQPELKKILKNYEANTLTKLTKKQESNKTYLVDVRKKLGEKLGRKNQPISQLELDILINKTDYSRRIESADLRQIAPEDKKKLKDLLTKSPSELENLFKDYKANKITEGQEDSRTYLVGVRTKLGKMLGRNNGKITRGELDTLIGKTGFSKNTEEAMNRKIAPEDQEKLNGISAKSSSELKLLLEPFQAARDRKKDELADQGQALAETLLEQNPNLDLEQRGHHAAFIVRDDYARYVDYDSQQTSKSQRLSTYASTLALANWPRGGEFQGSIKHDGRSIALSSNYSGINTLVSKSIKMASDLQNLAVQSLISHNIEAMSREDAMNNREIRHPLKLYERLPHYLELDAGVLVPQSMPGKSGIHAEIRIVSEEEWTKSNWDVPRGTKYPCLGCYLHLNSQEIEIGHFHGPLWLTNTGLSQQLKASSKDKNKIGEMSSTQISDTAELLANSYAQLPDDSKFAMGLTRYKKPTYDHDADSESDLDEETFTRVVKRIKAHQSGALPTTLKKDVNGLFINQTVGDGNCFFHAVHEAMHNIRSTQADQAKIRQTVIDQLQNNPRVRGHLFGENNPDLASIMQVVAGLGQGEWTKDYTVGYVAQALNLTIHIYNEDGSHRYTGNPTDTSTSDQTIHITYTGNHFNSHTQSPLS